MVVGPPRWWHWQAGRSSMTPAAPESKVHGVEARMKMTEANGGSKGGQNCLIPFPRSFSYYKLINIIYTLF